MCSKIKTDFLRKHLLVAEAIKRALAKRFGENEEVWGLAGITHDIDCVVWKIYEHTTNYPS